MKSLHWLTDIDTEFIIIEERETLDIRWFIVISCYKALWQEGDKLIYASDIS